MQTTRCTNNPNGDTFRTPVCGEWSRRVSGCWCRLFFVVFLVGTLTVACGKEEPETPPSTHANPTPLSIAPTDAQTNGLKDQERARQIASEVVQTLKRKDMERLARLAHPEKGVRFSSSVSINLTDDLRFSPDQIRTLSQDTTALIWGTSDGSGDPIRLSFNGYFDRYVYDADFANADSVGINSFIGQSNTANTLMESYPKAVVMEYYRKGTNLSYEGMDWRSLYLILENIGGDWYVTGIAHNQWTI